MNALQAAYGSQGFEVIAFPSGIFNNQEPADTGKEILNGIKYVRPGGGYVPNFQMFHKIDVNGASEHPLYTYLKAYCPQVDPTFQAGLQYSPLREGDVNWNWETFLAGRHGRVLKRFHPTLPPSELRSDIEEALRQSPKF